MVKLTPFDAGLSHVLSVVQWVYRLGHDFFVKPPSPLIYDPNSIFKTLWNVFKICMRSIVELIVLTVDGVLNSLRLIWKWTCSALEFSAPKLSPQQRGKAMIPLGEVYTNLNEDLVHFLFLSCLLAMGCLYVLTHKTLTSYKESRLDCIYNAGGDGFNSDEGGKNDDEFFSECSETEHENEKTPVLDHNLFYGSGDGYEDSTDAEISNR